MLYRLIAMCIIAHVHHGHFAYFVNRETIIAVIIDRRHGKHGVKHSHKPLFTTHQLLETFGIVENRPCIVPCVALGKGIAPFQGRKRFGKGAVGIAPAHQRILFVKEILIIHSTTGIDLQL